MLGIVLLPIPLSIVPREYFTFPYYVVLLGFVIAFAAALAIFPSMRKYRRRRNIMFYIAAALVVSLLLYQIDTVGRRAILVISCDGAPQYLHAEVGQLTVEATNWGEQATNLLLVIDSVNTSFQPEQNFIHVKSTTIKVPFLLEERWSPRNRDWRNVSFLIDENVSGFSFSISWEQQGPGQLVVSSFDYALSYAWNGTQNCYVMNSKATVT